MRLRAWLQAAPAPGVEDRNDGGLWYRRAAATLTIPRDAAESLLALLIPGHHPADDWEYRSIVGGVRVQTGWTYLSWDVKWVNASAAHGSVVVRQIAQLYPSEVLPEISVQESGLRRASKSLILPGIDAFAIAGLGKIPAELTPLYVMLSAIYQVIGGGAPHPVVVVSSQMVHALEHLGFEAELIVACTSIYRVTSPNRSIADIGIRDHPPTVRPDGSSDGHAVVWVDSFKRCIDLGICKNRALQRASKVDQVMTMPSVIRVGGGRSELLDPTRSFVAPRHPFLLQWMFFPSWRDQLDPLMDLHAKSIEQGAVALAHVVVEILSSLMLSRDLRKLNELYPRLSDLLGGRVHLPKPDEGCLPYKADLPSRISES